MIGIIAFIVALMGWIMFIFNSRKNRKVTAIQWLGVALCGNLMQILYVLLHYRIF